MLAVIGGAGVSICLTQGPSVAGRTGAVVVSCVVVGGTSVQAEREGAVVGSIKTSEALVASGTGAGEAPSRIGAGASVRAGGTSSALVHVCFT